MQDISPQIGGGHTFEADILAALLRHGGESAHEFVILCNSETAGSLSLPLPANFELVVMPRRGRVGALRDTLLRCFAGARATLGRASPLDEVARARRIDFLWFAGAGAHFTNLPYLTVVWDLQHRSLPWFPEFSAGGVWDRRELALWFLHRASFVLTGTRVGQREICEWLGIPEERIRIHPHPTPSFALAQADPTRRDAPASSAARPYLFYPAQFWPHKNHVNLVLGFERAVKHHGVDLDLLLCGADKGNRAHVEQCVARCGLQDRIRIEGFVSRAELIERYRGARALTYLSWGGPENLPPLEAFALGCPVIAARVAGAQEQLGDAALLVDPADPAQLADAIVVLERDATLRATLTQRGLQRAQRHTGADYVRGVFACLQEFEAIARCWPNR